MEAEKQEQEGELSGNVTVHREKTKGQTHSGFSPSGNWETASPAMSNPICKAQEIQLGVSQQITYAHLSETRYSSWKVEEGIEVIWHLHKAKLSWYV